MVRYAYGTQLEAVAWNLNRLAQILLGIEERAALIVALEAFTPAFDAASCRRTIERLGFSLPNRDGEAWRFSDEDTAFENAACTFLLESQMGFGYFEAYRRELPRFEPVNARALDRAYFAASESCELLIDPIESLLDVIAERDERFLCAEKLVEIAGMREALGVSS